MRVVMDTNVLVSALLTRNGVPARVLAHLLSGRPVLLADSRILAEYRRVVPRPRFRLSSAVIADVLSTIDASALMIDAVPLGVLLPDPDDLPFLEVAAAGGAHALVTGNARHFVPERGAHGVRVVSPREALELLAG